MSPLEKVIVDCLANSFISGYAVDPRELARYLRPRFSKHSETEITFAITRVASGIGVSIKEYPHAVGRKKAVDRACV